MTAERHGGRRSAIDRAGRSAGRSRAGLGLGPKVRPAAATFGPAAVIVGVQQLLFPLPDGMMLQGVTLGLLSAMVAVGMALIYRANRILNFAQGELGLAPVVLSVTLIQSFAWNYFLGLTVGLVAALVLGALVELAIIRRFFKAPRLILTVATIGLAQMLAVVSLFLPRWLADLAHREAYQMSTNTARLVPPWDIEIVRDPLVFDGAHVLAWIIAPLALLGVALLLRFTTVGIAVRASAERADRARLLGVPVKRLHTGVWTLGALLSFVGLFLRAGVTGLPPGVTFSQTILLLALAALTLGRLSDLPAVGASAVALGLLEQGVHWNEEIVLFRTIHPFGVTIELPELATIAADRAVLVTPIVGLVIVVALLVRRAPTSRAALDVTSSWSDAEDVRAVPPQLRDLWEVRLTRWTIGTVGAAVLLALPHVLGTADSLKASAVAIYAVIALSIVILTGWAGQVSLGQVGFVGIGAAVGTVATQQWGLDLTLALFVAGLAGALVAVVVGLPALRLRGFYLAVVTLAFGLATTAYFLDQQYFPWVPRQNARVERPPLFGRWSLDSPTRIYYVCLAGAALMFFLVHGVRRSRTGRVLIALRENERAAQAYGISVKRAKLTAFALSGFVAAFAGALLVHHQQAFSLGLVSPDQNLVVFTGAVVGGLGSLLGAALGALYLQGGKWFLPPELQLLSTSIGVLIVLLVLPGGLGGAVYRGRDLWLGWVANRRGITAPTLATAHDKTAPGRLTPEKPAGASVRASASPQNAGAGTRQPDDPDPDDPDPDPDDTETELQEVET